LTFSFEGKSSPSSQKALYGIYGNSSTKKKVHSVQVMGKNKNKTHHFTGEMKQKREREKKNNNEWLRL
jgi:hypothetical protein